MQFLLLSRSLCNGFVQSFGLFGATRLSDPQTDVKDDHNTARHRTQSPADEVSHVVAGRQTEQKT